VPAKSILVTGATGFLGRHTMLALTREYGEQNVKGISSKDYDLMDPKQVDKALSNYKPDVVIHLAAYSGGIGANRTYPADFYFRNTILTALMFEYSHRHKVKKLVYPMGGCSYPAKAKSPITVDQMWEGFPQSESAPYSLAKKMGIIASQSYHTQYGLTSTVIVPGNMYGQYDNFELLNSHVVPAMIRRYYEARLKHAHEVVMWGSGKPTRDFVYAADVAATFPYFIEASEISGPINISSGTRTSIRNLAELIAELTGFEGSIKWDAEKPDGQIDKIFSTEKLRSLGLGCSTPLREGLKLTIDWFAKSYNEKSDGLRI